MADCDVSGKYTGKRTLVEVNLSLCSDTYPTESDWETLGVLTSKDIDISADTVESSADDIEDGFKETFNTFLGNSFSFSGEQKVVDDNVLADLVIFYDTQMASAKQPALWLRVTTPVITYTFWVVMTTYSESNATDALATFSVAFAKTSSTLVPKVEKTTTE